jgi:hypothetical protein
MKSSYEEMDDYVCWTDVTHFMVGTGAVRSKLRPGQPEIWIRKPQKHSSVWDFLRNEKSQTFKVSKLRLPETQVQIQFWILNAVPGSQSCYNPDRAVFDSTHNLESTIRFIATAR